MQWHTDKRSCSEQSLCKIHSWFKKPLQKVLKARDKGSQLLLKCNHCRVQLCNYITRSDGGCQHCSEGQRSSCRGYSVSYMHCWKWSLSRQIRTKTGLREEKKERVWLCRVRFWVLFCVNQCSRNWSLTGKKELTNRLTSVCPLGTWKKTEKEKSKFCPTLGDGKPYRNILPNSFFKKK